MAIYGGQVSLVATRLLFSLTHSYKMGLVSAGRPVLLLSCTNECRKRSFHLVGALFLAFQAILSLEERSLDGGPDY